MASGILGKIEPGASTYKTLYKPSSVTAAITISIQSRSASAGTVRVALAQSASTDPTPGDGEFIIYDLPIGIAGSPEGHIDITGHVISSGNNGQVVVWCSIVDVDFLVTGIEEAV